MGSHWLLEPITGEHQETVLFIRFSGEDNSRQLGSGAGCDSDLYLQNAERNLLPSIPDPSRKLFKRMYWEGTTEREESRKEATLWSVVPGVPSPIASWLLADYPDPREGSKERAIVLSLGGSSQLPERRHNSREAAPRTTGSSKPRPCSLRERRPGSRGYLLRRALSRCYINKTSTDSNSGSGLK